MVDPQAIRNRLRILGMRLTALRTLASMSPERFSEMSDEETLAERHLQVAIQAALDIGNHLIREHSDRVPQQYHEVFPLLAELNVIEAELAERLADGARLRNVLVHMYLDVDPAQVYEHLGELDDLDSFARAVEAWLEKNS